MHAKIHLLNHVITVNLARALDISIAITGGDNNLTAWHLKSPQIVPLASVKDGASVNFNNILFNPHAHGTHTECLGHITKDFYALNQQLTNFFFIAELISVIPEQHANDLVITKNCLHWQNDSKLPIDALIIRTLPNSPTKKSRQYSATNPPYLAAETAIYLVNSNINHLLVDLPSVDKEQDEGKLLAHKAFWRIQDVDNVSSDARFTSTITEMIYVDDDITDGLYLLNLQIPSFVNDAAPSKPVLYRIEQIIYNEQAKLQLE